MNEYNYGYKLTFAEIKKLLSMELAPELKKFLYKSLVVKSSLLIFIVLFIVFVIWNKSLSSESKRSMSTIGFVVLMSVQLIPMFFKHQLKSLQQQQVAAALREKLK